MKHSNKLLSVLISLLMMLSACLPLCAVATAEAAVIGSGSCGKDGNNLTWTLTEDGVVTVSGTGEMADYADYKDEETGQTVRVSAPWKTFIDDMYAGRLGYANAGELEQAAEAGTVNMLTYYTAVIEAETFFTKAVIAEGVTGIGAEAFYGLHITEVSLPSTLEKIGAQAFEDNRLSVVTFPDGLLEIGDRAFADNKLSAFTVPASVTKIAEDCLIGNDDLQTVTVLSDVLLNCLLLPSPGSGMSFSTYEEYSAYRYFLDALELLEALTNRVYYRNETEEYFLINYDITLEDARELMDLMFDADIPEAKEALGIPQDATNEESRVWLEAKINSILGTELEEYEIYELEPEFSISPALYMEAYTQGLSADTLALLTLYYPYIKAAKEDRGLYKKISGMTEEELQSVLEQTFENLHTQYGIESATVDEAIAGIIARVNEALGKTGDDAYTEATAGTFFWAFMEVSDTLKTAAAEKFGLEEYVSNAGLNWFDIVQRAVAPWFTLRVNCDNANIAFLDEHDVNYELVHNTVEVGATEPTATEHGYTDGSYCTVCETWVSGHETVHNTLGESTILRQPTADEPGEAEICCTVCGEKGLYAIEYRPPEQEEEQDPSDGSDSGLLSGIRKALASFINFFMRLIKWLGRA